MILGVETCGEPDSAPTSTEQKQHNKVLYSFAGSYSPELKSRMHVYGAPSRILGLELSTSLFPTTVTIA